MPQISIKALEAFYRDEGRGIPVVLGHCSTGSSGQWREHFKRMTDRFRLVAPDHIGYGRTPLYRGEIPLVELEIAIVEAMLDLLAQPVHLVGHSYGGLLLARAAVRNPKRMRSLTLIEPTLFYLLGKQRPLEHAEIKAVADRVIRYFDENDADEAARGFIDYWVRPGAYNGMSERARDSVRSGMVKLRIEWAIAFEPYGATIEALSALPMPIQLIEGSETTPAARAVMDILRELWPHTPYAKIDNAGHMSPVTHTEAVNEIIDKFVSRTPAST
jgi:pimeloyl-ACP methyl ester carboxylesterase